VVLPSGGAAAAGETAETPMWKFFSLLKQSVHEGRIYTVKLFCDKEYPDRPPSVRFHSRINMNSVNQETGVVSNQNLILINICMLPSHHVWHQGFRAWCQGYSNFFFLVILGHCKINVFRCLLHHFLVCKLFN
jgi:hypothetical protein